MLLQQLSFSLGLTASVWRKQKPLVDISFSLPAFVIE